MPGTEEPYVRPSIDQRAAKRIEMEQSGRDRYDSLLRHLQAGREIPVLPRRGRFPDLDIHPSARTVVLIAVAIAVVWLGAIAVTDWLRRDKVDTWAGPDATVQSGQRLAGCADVSFPEDVYFPAWVRFDGKIYHWTDRLSPIGSNGVGQSYERTGYTLGDLELFRIINDIEGREGRRIMIRQGDSMAGAVYVLADCGASVGGGVGG